MEEIHGYFQPDAPLVKTNGVWQLGDFAEDTFEEEYLAVRKAEGRVLTDVQVLELPQSPHPKFEEEWAVRRKTCKRWEPHSKPGWGPVLEVGCGNGWFAHFLAQHDGITVGLDVNRTELEQAARVFKSPFLDFLQADFFDPQ